MNELGFCRGKSISFKECKGLERDKYGIKVTREITYLALGSIASVDLAVMELFSSTLEEAEEIVYQRRGFLTKKEKQQMDEITEGYEQRLLEIIQAHNDRVLQELVRCVRRLESIDPDWQLLLPSNLLDK